MRQWYNARESVARTLSFAKRPTVRFGGGDIRALLNATLYSQTSSSCWDLNLQDALFWTLLYATGARPGEFAYSRGYREQGHYLKVEDLEFRRVGEDSAGPIFIMLIQISWLKGKRFKGKTYVLLLLF
jgi:hypothetical protein